jgi:hypothetical protein
MSDETYTTVVRVLGLSFAAGCGSAVVYGLWMSALRAFA